MVLKILISSGLFDTHQECLGSDPSLLDVSGLDSSSRIQNICCRFLWRGNRPGRIYAWAKWDALTLPKKWGGWGLKKLDDFSSALVAKLGWHLVASESLWARVAYSKYIAPTHVL